MELPWGIDRRALAPPTYPDRYWADAYEIALAAADGGLILAPETIESGSDVICYDLARPDGCYAAIVMHKGMIGRLPLALEDMIGVFAPIYENDVFIVLQSIKQRVRLMQRWAQFVTAHTRRTSRFGAFIHIPKTAGTSIVRLLDERLRSFKYFGRRDEFQRDADKDRFDFWAGHFYLCDLIVAGRERGWISTILREPRARLTSAILHARRIDAPGSAMTPGMRAMRDLSLKDFLHSEFARAQIGAASRALGLNDSNEDAPPQIVRVQALDAITRLGVEVFAADAPQAWAVRLDPTITGPLPRANESLDALSEDELAYLDAHDKELFEDERAFVAEALARGAVTY